MYDNQYDEIVLGRYSRFTKKSLSAYFQRNKVSGDTVEPILQRLEYYIDNPLHFSDKIIPEVIIKNREIILPETKKLMAKVRESYNPTKIRKNLNNLFIDHLWLVRYTTGMWLLPNPGVAIEMTQIRSNMDKKLLYWLESEYGVKEGEKVIHRHVIQNKRRRLLKGLGINVPFMHWDKSYYIDTMIKIQEIHLNNEHFKGIISDGSWTYNPKMYEIAPDGRPFAAFSFLADDRLVGDRLFMKKATMKNDQVNQLKFAIESERRKKYVERGILDIDVYYTFYPRERLLAQDFVQISSWIG